LLPLFIYLIDHTLKLDDYTGGAATFGVMGVLGWLLVGLLADGSSGVGWNNVGVETYLGVKGQGVSGLLAASGYAPDWPAQMNAQLLGAVSIVAWVMLVAGGMFRAGVWLTRRREENVAEAEEI
jgi:Amt family ammonium transporter